MSDQVPNHAVKPLKTVIDSKLYKYNLTPGYDTVKNLQVNSKKAERFGVAVVSTVTWVNSFVRDVLKV